MERLELVDIVVVEAALPSLVFIIFHIPVVLVTNSACNFDTNTRNLGYGIVHDYLGQVQVKNGVQYKLILPDTRDVAIRAPLSRRQQKIHQPL